MKGCDRSWAEISLTALQHNVQFIRKQIGKDRKIIAVVKADAYGHGAVEVARCLVDNGVEMLGVANVREGLELREAGLSASILLLGAALPEEMEEGIKAGLIFTLSSFEEWETLEHKAERVGIKARAHVKFDTGMGRLGFFADRTTAVRERILRSSRWLVVEAYYSHLACADEEDEKMTLIQEERFRGILRELPQRPWHLANSAGLMRFPSLYGDAVRPGLMVYGVSPLIQNQEKLRPVLTWKSRVSLVRHMRAGMTISYGATYRLKEDAWVGVVSVGYADGYPRKLSNNGEILVKGRRCPILGRVTMDAVMVDLSSIYMRGESIQTGEEVTLVGKCGSEEISVRELAERTGVIPWEVLTGISKRVRRYIVA
ncbi:MAG: alanine racemase [Methylacidiphilales bacterium]|nr:alanine racemase [Candidatus Methylacidiphilales bacterium]MDW8349228.1 alanine racemase [Verrucomicrobiae bacterium]